MRLFLFLSLLLATASPAPSPVARPQASAARPSPDPLSPDALFSRRALRRAKLLIQMRVMQLREERLDCLRAALRRQLPDALWDEVPRASRGAADARLAAQQCERLLKF